jgi:Family of unknown function (DUF6527)
MNFFLRLWQRFSAWFRSWRHKPLRVIIMEELPDELSPDVVYVAGEKGNHWFVAMLCPCGCRETLHMGLLADTRPRWRLTIHEDNTASLHPSVWRQVGCRSHFFIVRGQIRWCEAGQTAGR